MIMLVPMAAVGLILLFGIAIALYDIYRCLERIAAALEAKR
jgi:hypothetical protein